MKLSIVKIGGNVIEDSEKLNAFLTAFSQLDGPKILIHGGGKLATQMANSLGIKSQLIGGRRITNAETLKVITMVYAGQVNKTIVASLQAKKCNAIGLSGADGNTLSAHKRPVKDIDFGFVGDIDRVNGKTITELLRIGLLPVFCAMTHDGNGQLLNTNADTIASEIAISLSANYDTTLFYCFEKKGVLRNVSDEHSVIPEINQKTYTQLLAENRIADGMLPKLKNCFHALQNGTQKVCVGDVSMLLPTATQYTTISL